MLVRVLHVYCLFQHAFRAPAAPGASQEDASTELAAWARGGCHCRADLPSAFARAAQHKLPVTHTPLSAFINKRMSCVASCAHPWQRPHAQTAPAAVDVEAAAAAVEAELGAQEWNMQEIERMQEAQVMRPWGFLLRFLRARDRAARLRSCRLG